MKNMKVKQRPILKKFEMMKSRKAAVVRLRGFRGCLAAGLVVGRIDCAQPPAPRREENGMAVEQDRLIWFVDGGSGCWSCCTSRQYNLICFDLTKEIFCEGKCFSFLLFTVELKLLFLVNISNLNMMNLCLGSRSILSQSNQTHSKLIQSG